MPLVPKRSANLAGWSRGDVELHMRWTLLNWLLDVASADVLNLTSPCVSLAFSIIDLHLSGVPESGGDFSKQSLHILGITALFIASKIHGDYLPEAADFLYYLDDASYTLDHLVQMEKTILRQCDFAFFSNVDDEPATEMYFSVNPFTLEDDRGSHLLFNYVSDLCVTDHRSLAFSAGHMRGAIQALCEALSGTRRAFSSYHKPVIESILDIIHDEKLRIETGKRTAVQRKHTRLHEGTHVINSLFEGVPRLRHVLSKQSIDDRGIMTRSGKLVGTGVVVPQKRKRSLPSVEKDDSLKVARVRCKGFTRRGKRCKLPVLGPGYEHCWKHV